MDLAFATADGDDWGDEDDPNLPPVGGPIQEDQLSPPSPSPPPSKPPVQAVPPEPQRSPLDVEEKPPERAPSPDPPKPVQQHPPSKIHRNSLTRYFCLKSNSHKNLVLSIENNVWATQRHNEEKLTEALRASPHVILLFSVNNSGGFQGYAKMVGLPGKSKKGSVFKDYGRGAFDVKWLRLNDLEFSVCGHIQNPWNEHKSVKISRDGQEFPLEVGRELCDMIDARVFQANPETYKSDEDEPETGGPNGTMNAAGKEEGPFIPPKLPPPGQVPPPGYPGVMPGHPPMDYHSAYPVYPGVPPTMSYPPYHAVPPNQPAGRERSPSSSSSSSNGGKRPKHPPMSTAWSPWAAPGYPPPGYAPPGYPPPGYPHPMHGAPPPGYPGGYTAPPASSRRSRSRHRRKKSRSRTRRTHRKTKAPDSTPFDANPSRSAVPPLDWRGPALNPPRPGPPTEWLGPSPQLNGHGAPTAWTPPPPRPPL
eukprot:gnl/MRDRNA2_/MRDRNA2_112727_c0_seq1.p1 gnl/MRDRNA2_/MRDRNA2_112727_c0~~gnl/MRDRNA2_/MRDRNA2_112727_c0_seq1.p1  ORF type:complete len:499 (-),score=86.65 gnl/MRDRNA2_/MRDRNA2_112727_c0_seq1:210-1640(-)